MHSIGNRLYELRKSQNITQEKLAEQLNVSRQSVSNWELDKSLPDTDKLLALATLYGVSLDYIAYGQQEEVEQEETVAGEERGEREEETSENIKNILKLLSDSEIANKNHQRTSRFLLAACILTSACLIPLVVFYISIMSHLASDSKEMNSELVAVNQILEQYTYAEVSKLDAQGNFAKDRVWLDTKDLSEGDYIFTYTQAGKPKQMKFEYYTKTMMIPFVIMFVFFAIDLLIVISLFQIKGEKARK